MNTFWELFDNTILFFALISLVYIWPAKFNKNQLSYKLSMGVTLSIMAVITMLNSVHVGNGLYIDARYAIPIITIIFFGTIPGIMVIVTIIIMRVVFLGGAGASIGVSYAILQGVTTWAYAKWYYNKRDDSPLVTSVKLFLYALILQAIFLSFPIYFLPLSIALPAIEQNWYYLITIYPFVVFAFSLVVGYQEQHKQKLEEAREKDRFFKLTLQRSPSPMAIYDEDGLCIHLNEAWEEQSGYTKEEFKTMSQWLTLVSLENNSNIFFDDFNGDDNISLLKSEYTLKTKHNGVRIWSFERKAAGSLPNGKHIYVSVAKDVTKQKQYEQDLINISYHDFLTGLNNRRYYDDVFQHYTFHSSDVFIIYGDMNNLKSLNDFYGHTRGDEAIIACTNVLKEVFEEQSHYFRFGGDEYLIITEGFTRDTIIQKMDEVAVRMKDLQFGEVSIGITLGMEQLQEGMSLDQAIINAESRMYEYKIFESTSARSGTVDVILTMLFEKDSETERHSKRVQEICRCFAKELNLNTNQQNLLLRAGVLHDIGKILIPTSIILSKNRLTTEEYSIMQRHSYLGYRILSSKGYLKQIGEIVLSHHEHVDGKGYPNGLKGEDIPYFSRILSIVDAYEAMTSNRTYRSMKTREEAQEELLRCSGTQFDAELVKRFIPIIPDLPVFVPID